MPNKAKGKTEVGTTSKPKEEVFDELDFPFSNTVHQDDDFGKCKLDYYFCYSVFFSEVNSSFISNNELTKMLYHQGSYKKSLQRI